MSGKDKEIKDNYVNSVFTQMREKGFEEILKEAEQRDFIRMMAAAYYSGQTNDQQTLQYISDIVDEEEKKKTIIGIMRDIRTKYQLEAKNRAKAQKIQKDKKRQANRDKAQQKLDQVKKKVKADGPQLKNQEGDQQKEQKFPPGHQKGLKQQLEVQGKTKCKFFPFCKNQQTCQFFHPTQKCTYFPHCRFGQNCLYQHQVCRYKDKCTKFNCFYDHPFKKPANPIQAILKGLMSGKNQNNFNKNANQKKKKPYVPNNEPKQQE